MNNASKTNETPTKRKSTSQLLKKVKPYLYRHSENGSYYGKKKHRGKIKTKAFKSMAGIPITDERIAKDMLKEWLANLDQPEVVTQTLAERLEVHRQAYTGHSEKTRKDIEWFINTLGRTFAAALSKPIKQIQFDDLERWFATIRPKYKPSSYNKLSMHMAEVFKSASANHLIDRNPFDDLKKATKYRKIILEPDHIPTDNQFEKLIATIRAQRFSDHAEDSADVCEFYGLAALGQAEASFLTWEKIEFENGVMKCKRKKTGKFFDVPIYPHLRPLLEKLNAKRENEDPTEPVFKVKDPKKALAAACATLSFHNFTPRDLRKYGVNRMLSAGANPDYVANWQAHRDAALLHKRYNHVISDDYKKGEKLQLEKLAALVK